MQSLVERAVARAPWLFGGRTPRNPSPPTLSAPPALSRSLPLVGHTVEFVTSTIDLLRRARLELGEIAALSVAGRRMVAVFGPEAQEAVFRAPDTQLSPAEAYKIMTPVFGKDIVYDAPPDKMGEQLKMLLPALKDRRMRTYGENVVAEVEQSIAGWGERGEIDVVDYCRVLTNFTSSRCLLGREFRERMTDEFARVYHDLERGVTPIAYLNAHLPIPSFIKRDRARVKMEAMITKIVAERRREGREGEDFLQTLMEARYGNGAALSEHEITGLLLAAMFAGHHTSSVTTAWTLVELLRNPSYLARVVDEIDRTFGFGASSKGPKAVTFQSLRELTHVEHAVKEALRLHPPLFMLVRVAKEDFVYKQWVIAKGTWILISPTVAHEIQELFRDPLKFDPDRFAPPREEDKRDFAYIPFGGGRHKCLGNAFALLQVKAILAILLGRYRFELAGDAVASDFHGLVIGPREPLRLRYARRSPTEVQTHSHIYMHKESASNEHVNMHKESASNEHINMHTHKEAAAAKCPFHVTEGAKAYRIELDRDLCQGHAACVGEAPELFRIADDGRVALVSERPAAALREKAIATAKFCPTRTIRVVEE